MGLRWDVLLAVRCIQGVSWEHTNQVVVSRFEGGAIEPVQIGPMFLTATLPTVDYLHDTDADGTSEKQVEIVYKILRQGPKPILFYENNLDVSKAYVMRVDTGRASQVVDKLMNKVSSAGLKLIEAI